MARFKYKSYSSFSLFYEIIGTFIIINANKLADGRINHICVLTQQGRNNPISVYMSCPEGKKVWVSRILSSRDSMQGNFNNLCTQSESLYKGCFYYNEDITSKTREKCKTKSNCTHNIPDAYGPCNQPGPEGYFNVTYFYAMYRCIPNRGKHLQDNLIQLPIRVCDSPPGLNDG